MTASLIGFDTLRQSIGWARWAALSRDAPPFLAPEFFALARPFVGGADALVACAGSDTRMIGALPLALENRTLRALCSPRSPGFDYSGTPAGIAAIWRCLRDDRRWDELALDHVPAESLLATMLPLLARADGCFASVRATPARPFLALPGFASKLAPQLRARLDRCAAHAGHVVFERIIDPSEDELEEAAAIEAMPGATPDPRTRELDRRVAALFGARGQAWLAFLRIGGRRVATSFVLEDRGTLYALRIGFDPAYARLDPCDLLVWRIAEDAEQRGLKELDLGDRASAWKLAWTAAVHDRRSIAIYRRSMRGLARFAIREIVAPRLHRS